MDATQDDPLEHRRDGRQDQRDRDGPAAHRGCETADDPHERQVPEQADGEGDENGERHLAVDDRNAAERRPGGGAVDQHGDEGNAEQQQAAQ